MPLAQRLIDVTFTLAPDANGNERTFSESNTNTLTLQGLRVSAKITKAATPSQATLSMQVFGMTLSLMNQIATFGMAYGLIPKNTVLVTAGDVESGMSQVFYGTVMQAWADFQAAPEVPFHVEAQTLGAEAVIPATPASFQGSTDVSTVMQQIAGTMGCGFENNGVTTKLADPYFYGSSKSQADACARAAGINWTVDNNTLAIWPNGGARSSDVPEISKDSGMVGYPTFANFLIIVKIVFNPAVKFGAQFTVKSTLPPANATWNVFALDHDLNSMVFNGGWYTTIQGFNPKSPGGLYK